MRRLLNFTCVAFAALIATAPFSSSAQVKPQVDRSLSWCAAPAAKPEWKVQPIFLVIEEERDVPEMGMTALRLPASRTAEILEVVRKHLLIAETQSSTAGQDGKPSLATNPSYRIQALMGDITFRLRGNGTVDSLVLRDVRDSTLFNPMAAALRSLVAPGVLTPFGGESDMRSMTLQTAMSRTKSGASWEMFKMDVPRERFVTVLKRPTLSYPYEAGKWKAEVNLRFYVDTAGNPEPKTIVAVPSPDSADWPQDGSRLAYKEFVRVARSGVERSRFKPAEFLGCRIRRLVSQPLVFDIVSGR